MNFREQIREMAFERVDPTCPVVDTYAGVFADQCASEIEGLSARDVATIKRKFRNFAEAVKRDATRPLRREIMQRCRQIVEARLWL